MTIEQVLEEISDVEARVRLTDGRTITIIRRPGMTWQQVLDEVEA